MFAKTLLLTFAASASAIEVCIGAVTGLPDVDVWPNTPAPDVSVAVAVGADRWESESHAHDEVYVCETETVQDSNSYTFDKCCEVSAPAGAVYTVIVFDHDILGTEVMGHAHVDMPGTNTFTLSSPEHPEWTDLGAVTITIGAAAPAAALATEGSAAVKAHPRAAGGIAVFAFGALVVAGLAVVRAMAAKKSAAEPAAAADEPAAQML